MADSIIGSAGLLDLLSLKHKETAEDDPLKLMVVGITGSGKSVLINNILGTDLAKVSSSCKSSTTDIVPYAGRVRDVDVMAYDSPGLLDTRGRDKENLTKIEECLKTVDVVVFCFSMITGRMSEVVRDTFATYHDAGLPWNKTFVALTFANVITHLTPTQPPREVFRRKRAEWEAEIRTTLRERVGLPEESVLRMHFCPTTISYDRMLPNGEPWFGELWMKMLKCLEPLKRAEYIEMFRDNIAVQMLHSANPDTSGSFTRMAGSSKEEGTTMKLMFGRGKETSQAQLEDIKQSILKPLPKRKHNKSSSSLQQSINHPVPKIVITDDTQMFTELAEAISGLVAKLLLETPQNVYKATKELIRDQWGVV